VKDLIEFVIFATFLPSILGFILALLLLAFDLITSYWLRVAFFSLSFVFPYILPSNYYLLLFPLTADS
jgi:hypothetical protein